MSRPLLFMPKIAKEKEMPEQTGDLWYLEHTNGHSKFYEVTIRNDGKGQKPFVIMTRHGRIGVNGRVLEYDRALTIEKARSLAQELVGTKLDKGYKQVRHQKAEVQKKPVEEEKSRFSSIDWE